MICDMSCSSTRAYIYPGHAVISARVVYTTYRVLTCTGIYLSLFISSPTVPILALVQNQAPVPQLYHTVWDRSNRTHRAYSHTATAATATATPEGSPHTHTQNRCFIPRAPAANQVGAQTRAPPLHFPHAIFLVLLFQGIGQMVIQGPPRIQEISCTTYTNHPAPTPRACQLSPHHPRRHIIHRKSRAVYQILQTHNWVVSTLYLLILQVLLPLTRVANRASAVFALRKTAVAPFLPRAANQRILGHLRKVKIWGGAIQGVLQNKPCATRKRYSVTIWTIQYRRRTLLPIKQSILHPRNSHHKASGKIQS